MSDTITKKRILLSELKQEEANLHRKSFLTSAKGQDHISFLHEIKACLLLQYQAAEFIVCSRPADDPLLEDYEDNLNEIFHRVMRTQEDLEFGEKKGDAASFY